MNQNDTSIIYSYTVWSYSVLEYTKHNIYLYALNKTITYTLLLTYVQIYIHTNHISHSNPHVYIYININTYIYTYKLYIHNFYPPSIAIKLWFDVCCSQESYSRSRPPPWCQCTWWFAPLGGCRCLSVACVPNLSFWTPPDNPWKQWRF